ncbi:MAG TPA: alpha/beta hydrolase [Caldimonas sp.]|jgi:pimeloyl-ACP methyl ester carboxylesterase|nr:alpha/beta hydrolase [Caldimonas sp.]HEX2541336.1 alpha/beta hydrolase [Caldimonas sp.]
MTASRPLVLLLHSSASSARQWDSLVAQLEPRFRVHALDLHGHGKRSAWRGPGSPMLADEAALALAPLLEHGGRAHVVGHSYGGAVALKLATIAPGLVRSVLAYEPVLFRWVFSDGGMHGPARDVLATVEFMAERFERGDSAGAARRFVEFWSGTGAWDALPAGAQQKIVERMAAVRAQFDALFHDPLGPAQLLRAGVPLTFLSGAETVAVTRRLAELYRLALPRARHEVLAGMGHMGPITHAAAVNARIVEHLEAHAVSAPARPSSRPNPPAARLGHGCARTSTPA